MIVRGIVILLGCVLTSSAMAQSPGHFPLDHTVPPGVLSHFHSIAEPGLYNSPQPVRVTLPGEGRVTFLGIDEESRPAPAQATLLVGHVYRIRISDLPGMPGVELYPTIELVHRLHPPVELLDEFPVPIDITEDEIASVLGDQMVTKVIYLERPDLAAPQPQENGPRVTDLRPADNLIETATRLGRPVVILRMGGRIPLSNSPETWPEDTAPVRYPAVPRE